VVVDVFVGVLDTQATLAGTSGVSKNIKTVWSAQIQYMYTYDAQ
jgi:hypothetical protein